MHRYFFVVLLMALMGIFVVVKAAVIMFAERQYWNEVADRFVKENIPKKPVRGNILSADGKLMAGSLPEYRIYMDYMYYDNNDERRAKGQARKDSVFRSKLDSIARGLHVIFPDKSTDYFRKHLQAGRRDKRQRHYLIYPNRISHTQYKEVGRLPFFRERGSGLHVETFNQRKKPFGSLARRVLGDLYADTAMGAKNGLELSFDSLLKGKDGIQHKQKVMNRYLEMVDVEPVDGCDIVTTIDVDMQDICEKALNDKLETLDGAQTGVAILMEVQTGEVKAMVNLERAADGHFYERNMHAISDLLEPGSTFKTASIMVALEDGYITPETEVNTGNGVMMMHGSRMKDHNWYRGGYGVIDVTRILEVSSNIGVSYLIDTHYGKDPQKFVDGLKRMSLDQPLHLQIPGEGKPNIRGPKERKFFSKTSLPWMSIGYETQVPPMNMLAFYNAIANDGVMVRPKFVRSVLKDGEVVKEYPTEVINPRICSEKTLTQIRTILERVVSHGLGKQAGNRRFSVSGKTGTAQVSQGAAGYKSGPTNYLVSFCGYFPSESPKYSCIVAIRKRGYPASGGTMAGPVFGKIAERVYAKNLRYDLSHAVDSLSDVIPSVMRGSLDDALCVLRELDVPVEKNFGGDRGAWGHAERGEKSLVLEGGDTGQQGTVPNVVGMGAKDAVYLLEQRGLKVRLTGVGKVRSQSLAAGSRAVKGSGITLQLK